MNCKLNLEGGRKERRAEEANNKDEKRHSTDREQQRGCGAGEKPVGAQLGRSLPEGKGVFVNLPHSCISVPCSQNDPICNLIVKV